MNVANFKSSIVYSLKKYQTLTFNAFSNKWKNGFEENPVTTPKKGSVCPSGRIEPMSLSRSSYTHKIQAICTETSQYTQIHLTNIIQEFGRVLQHERSLISMEWDRDAPLCHGAHHIEDLEYKADMGGITCQTNETECKAISNGELSYLCPRLRGSARESVAGAAAC